MIHTVYYYKAFFPASFHTYDFNLLRETFIKLAGWPMEGYDDGVIDI